MGVAGGVRSASIIAVALGILLGPAVPAISGGESEKTLGFLGDPPLIPSWRQIAVAEAPDSDAAHDIEAQFGGEQIKTKSPLAAFLLGGIVGFGSGQFYAKKKGAGYFFLGADLVFTGVVIGGIAAYDEQKDEGFLAGFEEIHAAAIALIGLGVSHTIQAVWGAYSAAEYNKSLSVMHTETSKPLESDGGGALAIRLVWRF